ncbi:NAD(P)/FAD-dependent oxidoreductase [Novosphingobium aerophilum]|uniref:NAD(P)/FAD-dependent oxidoreductase n=1 Tax=Novosphingobium TaxID=165696 RepID=UPI0010430460|nr:MULTISPECIES: FAD-dependent monooxygenase [unclassified Novosphingobium]TCM41433.1 flavin-dependent dehydrogenase [Novosphingobium sp. ST904]WRT95414.1 FAD-dependent monooxygenase [Novosphingobium sp. RL4]
MADVLVVGGGLAGGAAACLLARQGRDVLLLEREHGPHHKVCGEFLSVEAAAHLRQLGVDPASLGGVPIQRIRLVSGTVEAEAPLPFGAWGLSRHVLDEALLRETIAAGARVERGVRVLELGGCVARTSEGDREGEYLLLASGKLPLRERGTASTGRAEAGFVGFKMHYRLAPAAMHRLAGTIMLFLFGGGYAGLQMVEGGRANLCLVVRRSRLAQSGGDWTGLRARLDEIAALREMLADAEPLFDRPVTIANLNYGMAPARTANSRVLRLGDQWAMTASLTGDGMAIALRSAFVAAQSVMAGEDARRYDCRLAAEVRGQVRRAMAFQNMLDHPVLRQAGCHAARSFPALLTMAARATRLREWR